VKRRIIMASVLTVLALGINLVWFSSVFDVRSVRIFGTHYTTKSRIMQAAQIAIGDPIARINVGAVRQRVEAIPQVASVDVRRGFPHSIVIEVHERTPIAAASDPEGGWWLVDRTGKLFEKVAKAPVQMTEVIGYTEQFRGIGARIAAGFPRWLQLRVKTVRVYAREDVRLEMKNGKQVQWGGEERAARKAEVLFALLQVHAHYYDVSAPDAPATKK